MYIVSGSENIQEIFKAPHLHNKAYKALAVHKMFGMPKDILDLWMEDNSGHQSLPRPDSDMLPHLRLDYLTNSSILRFLNGNGLKPFARRFVSNITKRLSLKKTMYPEWTYIPDLYEFLQGELFPAGLEAMWGTEFLKLNPTFVEDIWTFSKALPGFAKGYPQWLYPRQSRARDACILGIKRWHQAAWAHFSNPNISHSDWDEQYGADIVRFRLEAWSKMPRMNAGGMAAEDLGMVWAYVYLMFC